jgi:hypothetical protein
VVPTVFLTAGTVSYVCCWYIPIAKNTSPNKLVKILHMKKRMRFAFPPNDRTVAYATMERGEENS